MNQVAPDQAADIAQSHSSPEPRDAEPQSCDKPRRVPARIFALLVIAVMVINAAPPMWSWLNRPKEWVSAVLTPVGLSQGQWAMFTPDPVLNNGWFNAEIQRTDGTQSLWNSPYWFEASSGDKFLRFRYLNYFNRLPNLWYHAAREDLADYLARQSDVPVESIKLYHTRMRLIMPEDGSLPKRDEVDWMFSSEIVAKRVYAPTSSQEQSGQP